LPPPFQKDGVAPARPPTSTRKKATRTPTSNDAKIDPATTASATATASSTTKARKRATIGKSALTVADAVAAAESTTLNAASSRDQASSTNASAARHSSSSLHPPPTEQIVRGGEQEITTTKTEKGEQNEVECESNEPSPKKRKHEEPPYADTKTSTAEERRALITEIKDHLELLKEFEGVIPKSELDARKTELFNSLPTPGIFSPGRN